MCRRLVFKLVCACLCQPFYEWSDACRRKEIISSKSYRNVRIWSERDRKESCKRLVVKLTCRSYVSRSMSSRMHAAAKQSYVPSHILQPRAKKVSRPRSHGPMLFSYRAMTYPTYPTQPRNIEGGCGAGNFFCTGWLVVLWNMCLRSVCGPRLGMSKRLSGCIAETVAVSAALSRQA